MSDILIAIIIGLVAGTIDVIPMIVQKLDKFSSISAFLHYFALGVIIPFVSWDIQAWLTGIIIGLLTGIPIMVLIFQQDKKAIYPIFAFSVVLGAAIGWAGEYFI